VRITGRDGLNFDASLDEVVDAENGEVMILLLLLL
jgi:hypothetical protein